MKALVILATVAIMIGGIVVGVAATKPTNTPPDITELGTKLDALIAEVDTIGADVSTIKGKVDVMDDDIYDIGENVTTLMSEVGDIKAHLAGIPVMACYHDIVSSYANEDIWVTSNLEGWTETYELAHFHITLRAWDLNASEEIVVRWGWASADHTWIIVQEETINADGLYTYEFDASSCEIKTWGIAEGDHVLVTFNATWTYVPLTEP